MALGKRAGESTHSPVTGADTELKDQIVRLSIEENEYSLDLSQPSGKIVLDTVQRGPCLEDL